MADEPILGTEPNATDPPVGDPPAGDPPASDPPVGDPPAGDPPQSGDDPPSGDENWLLNIPEELREHEALSGIESVKELAERFTSMPKPADIPDSDKYEIPEGFPKELGKWANERGLSQSQFTDVTALIQTAFGTSQKTQLALLNEQGQAKLQEWGTEADKIVRMSRFAVAESPQGEELGKLLKDTGYGSHPAVLEHFKWVAGLLEEGGFVPNDVLTPGGARRSAAKTLYPDLPSKEN